MSSDLAQARHSLHTRQRNRRLLRVSAVSSIVCLSAGLLLLLGPSSPFGGFYLSQQGLEETGTGLNGIEGGALASWAESSVYVERTNALHPSRPSSFGPHIINQPLTSQLYPISTFTKSDSYACEPIPSPNETLTTLPIAPAEGWIALVQRGGGCSFSNKVRYGAAAGASAVLIGDMSLEEGGLSAGNGGLLTPYSPDDTSDIDIPSAFVSRASYLSLLREWDAEQDGIKDGETPRGLGVTMSKDELFTWPLLDFLLLILFLPSLLTLLTVFSQRIRQLRQQKRERAPAEAVARLPIFLWNTTEKLDAPPANDHTAVQPAHPSQEHTLASELVDEEAAIGSPTRAEATESTPLLSHAEPRPKTLLERVRDAVPGRKREKALAQLDAALERPLNHKPRWASVECPICLCDFEKGERVMELPCGHLFHATEIMDWLLESRRLCPVCRASITEDVALAKAVPQLELESAPVAEQVDNATPPAEPIEVGALALPAAQRNLQSASPVASSSSVTLDSAVGGRRGD